MKREEQKDKETDEKETNTKNIYKSNPFGRLCDGRPLRTEGAG